MNQTSLFQSKTAPVVLRPYQEEALEAIWTEIFKTDSALCVLPTGSGKTEIMMALLKRALEVDPTFRATVTMGRVDLVTQTESRFKRMLDARKVGVWCGTLQRRERNSQILIASIQSVDAKKLPTPKLIVIDEVHRLNQKKGAYLRMIEQARFENPKVKLVGFTATPFRESGVIYGNGTLFPRIVYRKKIDEMIEINHLSDVVMKGSKDEFDTSKLRVRAGEYVQEDIDALVSDEALCRKQVADALLRMEGRTCVAWACANINHCNMVADILMELGERATTVHSKLDRQTRNKNLGAFMGGMMKHVVFVSVLSEGFDHPPIDCIVLMRPTRSPIAYVQTVGRGLRPSLQTGKSNCMVLDYGQVIKTLGPLDDPRVNSKKKKDEEESDGQRCCKQCLTYSKGKPKCPECGTEFPKMERRDSPPRKLDLKPYEGDILSSRKVEEPPQTLSLGPAVICMHQAKSGNQCVRITYRDSNILNRWGSETGVSEYFVISNPWAMQRLDYRLTLLDVSLPSLPFEGRIEVEGTFEVVKKNDGKYDKIISVKKTSGESPVRSYKPLYTTERDDDPTSFNFGANVSQSYDSTPTKIEDMF